MLMLGVLCGIEPMEWTDGMGKGFVSNVRMGQEHECAVLSTPTRNQGRFVGTTGQRGRRRSRDARPGTISSDGALHCHDPLAA